MKVQFFLLFYFACTSIYGQTNEKISTDTIYLEFDSLTHYLGPTLLEENSNKLILPFLNMVKFHTSGGGLVVIANYPSSNNIFLVATLNRELLEGVSTVFYSSGKIKEKANFYKNQLHGVLINYSPNGLLKKMIEYSKNKIDGTYTIFFDNGFVAEKNKYNNGVFTGEESLWHLNGVQLKDGFTKEGEDFGKQTYWYDNGEISYQGEVYNGIKVGENAYFYRNGQIKKSGRAPNHNSDSLKINEYSILEYRSGTDNSIKLDCSLYNEWYESGEQKIHLTPNLNDSQQIIYTEYFKNGNKKLEGAYVIKLLNEKARNFNNDSVPPKCWCKTGEWLFYNNEEGIFKRVKY